MLDRLKAYIVIAGLILVGVAIGQARSRKEVVYVVRQ